MRMGRGEGHDHSRDDTRHDLRDLHLEEGLQRGAAEIHCRLGQTVVHLLQLRKHLQNDIGHAEGDMRNQHGPEVQARGRAEESSHKHEHQHQGDTGDDVGVDHRDVCHLLIGEAHHLAAQTVNPHRRGRAHHRGHKRRRDGQDQGVTHGAERLRVAEQLPVPVERAARHHAQAL